MIIVTFAVLARFRAEAGRTLRIAGLLAMAYGVFRLFVGDVGGGWFLGGGVFALMLTKDGRRRGNHPTLRSASSITDEPFLTPKKWWCENGRTFDARLESYVACGYCAGTGYLGYATAPEPAGRPDNSCLLAGLGQGEEDAPAAALQRFFRPDLETVGEQAAEVLRMVVIVLVLAVC